MSSSLTTSNEKPTDETRSRSTLVVILLGALFCGFWLVDHTPFASEHYNPYGDVYEAENRTADRIQKVNLITAPARMCIALLGIGFLFLKPVEKIRNGGLIVLTAAMFVGFLFCSIVWSVNPTISAQKFLVLACFGVAAYSLARQMKMDELLTIFALICLGYLALGFVAEVLLGNFTPHKRDYRFVGTCHPNSLGVYSGFCCLISIVYFSYRPKLNSLLIVMFAVGILALMLTRSRTALAGFAMATAAVWFTKVNPNQRVLVISSTLLAFVVLGFAITLSPSNVRDRVAEKMAMGRTRSVQSLTGRVPLWEQLLDSAEERPLVGHGYLAYWNKEQIEILKDSLGWEIPHGHNMYLDWLLDGGVIGLGLFLLMFGTAAFVAFYRATFQLNRHAVFVFGFLMFAFVHGFAESLFKLPTFLAFMLVTLTLKMAMTVPAEKKSVETDQAATPRLALLEGAAG